MEVFNKNIIYTEICKKVLNVIKLTFDRKKVLSQLKYIYIQNEFNFI